MKVCFYGAGAWGTALAVNVSRHHEAVLFVRDANSYLELCQLRENQRYLPGVTLPPQLSLSNDAEAAFFDIDLLVVATPVAGLRDALTTARNHVTAPVVWLCKGVEEQSALLPHEVVDQVWPGVKGATLSGPSFALEVARGQPTALTAAASEPAVTSLVVEVFHHDALRVYRSDDVTGVEVGGALKNVLAIASGICDGLELGLNARAALITRGLSEMMRLGEALGAKPETLMGLTGLGDLILTCTGGLSRNRHVGFALGQGIPLVQILGELAHVAEGVRCTAAVLQRAHQLGVELPICEAVHAVLFDNQSPRSAVAGLLARAPRAER